MKIETIGARELQRKMEKIERAFDPAVRRIINRTVTSANTQTAKEIGQQINLKARTIKDQLRKQRARGRNLEGRLTVVPEGGSPGTPLIRFSGTRQLKRRGVSVKAKKGGKRHVLEGGFILSPKQGGAVVAVRQIQGGERVGRTPLDFPVGPGVTQLWRNGQRRRTRAEARRNMQRLLDRELRYRVDSIWAS